MEDRIIPVSYEEEMKQSYIDYAMSVIVDRALPDVRDGLKPVHRRILYAMKELNNTHDKPYKKSARIVGEVIGKYHPHGDSAVYDAMVRLAQDFNLMVPLIEGHGNFGSIDGDSAAAMRYTEARLAPVAQEILSDIEKSTVPFNDNFDNTLKEPVVLPSKFPHLLVNGVNGIAVGMSTNIPTHNLQEITRGIIRYIDNPNISVKQLMRTIKGPDFPTGGIISNKKDLYKIYEKGNGTIKIRGKVKVEPSSHGKKNVVITEIPYTYSGNKSAFIEKFINQVKDRKIEEVIDIRDESDKDGIRIVLEVKRGVDIDQFLNKLYTRTPLEDTFGVHMLALVDGKPQVLSLKDMIVHFVAFQKEITLKKYSHLLKKAKERQEILSGLLEATNVIDTIIEAIRGSKDVKMAKACLMHGKTDGIQFRTKKAEKQAKTFSFTEIQAQSILDMRLQRLIQLEINELNKELKKLNALIKQYKLILNDEETLMSVIKEYVEEIGKKYGTKRKTEIDDIETEEYVEEIVEEEIQILIDRFGYIKSTEISNIKRMGEDTIKEIPYTFTLLNTDKVALFTNKGMFYRIRALDIPKAKILDRGVPIENLTKMKNEQIIWVGKYEELLNGLVLISTKKGFVKVVNGSEFDTIRSSIMATKLKEDDEIVSIIPIKDVPDYVCMITKNDMALKFPFNEIPQQKRNSLGVSGLTMEKEDEVHIVYVLNKENENVITYHKKKINLNSIRSRKRNSKAKKL